MFLIEVSKDMTTKFPECSAATDTEGRYNNKLKWWVVFMIWVIKANVYGITPDYPTLLIDLAIENFSVLTLCFILLYIVLVLSV